MKTPKTTQSTKKQTQTHALVKRLEKQLATLQETLAEIDEHFLDFAHRTNKRIDKLAADLKQMAYYTHPIVSREQTYGGRKCGQRH